MTTNHVKQYVTSGVAAGVLSVSRDTVKRWARAGILPYKVSPTGRYMFRPADVEALLQPAGARGPSGPEAVA